MKIIETGPGDIGFVLWGHCQNLLDDPRTYCVIGIASPSVVYGPVITPHSHNNV